MSDLFDTPAPERPLGPVVSTDLYRRESLALEQELAALLDKPLAAIASRVATNVGPMLKDAYLSGLRDGFAQGVAAAHRGYGDGES